MEHTTSVIGNQAFCTCGWSINYAGNKYMTPETQQREAARAARLHPVQVANRHYETIPSRDGWTGD